MKKIEEIEKLSFEELESIAGDSSRKAPSGLKHKIDTALLSAEYASHTSSSGAKSYRFRLTPVFALAALALFFILRVAGQPKDSFSDPALAYAEVEKTFALISSKMGKGETMANEATESIIRINEVFNNSK